MRKYDDKFRNYTGLMPRTFDFLLNLIPDKNTGYQKQERCYSRGNYLCYIKVRKLKENDFSFLIF